jgi:hypothetical protein
MAGPAELVSEVPKPLLDGLPVDALSSRPDHRFPHGCCQLGGGDCLIERRGPVIHSVKVCSDAPHRGSRRLCQAASVAFPVPQWVVPADQQLVDAELLAADVARSGAYEAGVVAALRWVLRGQHSPLTDLDSPTTQQAAEEEFFVAGAVEFGDSPLSALVTAETAQGVGRTLSWLLGWQPQAPIDLPRRPVPTAGQLYEEAVASEPWRFRLPEERAGARLTAQREAARLIQLAARADGLAL